MSYLQVLLPSAVAEDFADQMARQDIMQFTDLNEDFQPFQRKYTGDIIHIQEIERQILIMEELLDNYEVFRDTEVTGDDLQSVQRPPDHSQAIQLIGGEIGDAYKKLKEQVNIEQELKKQLSQQEDSISVLQQIDLFLAFQNEAQTLLQQQREQAIAVAQVVERRPATSVPLLEVSDARDVGFKYFAGVVTIAQRVSFERQVFLSSRGNSFIQFDESGPESEEKIPFVVFFLGSQLKRSLRRLCQFMNIQICYESDNERKREDLLQEANSKRNDFYRIHSHTSNNLETDMKEVSAQIKNWKIALLQEKAIRITLNKFSINQGNNFLRAEGWCPTLKQDIIRDILDEVTKNKGVGRPVVQDTNPRRSSGGGHGAHGDDGNIVPTHFDTNGFTSGFQAVVDTYGVPRYKEFNPAVPTIMTFPFLFATMYGDIFHGSCVLIFGLLLIIGTSLYGWDRHRDENVRMFAGGRYLILFMGIFAIYNGLIYNDCISIMINGFNKSQWGYGFTSDGTNSVVLFQGASTPYAFGIDPVWHALDNQLTYANSLKMKLSVIIGVTQMTYGLFLKLSNHIQEGDMISVFFEFVPQFIFMMAFFGYMIFLIIYKWCIDWQYSALPTTPSLITVLIKMILSVGTIEDEWQIFEDATLQRTLQEILIILIFISVPWMLVFKPLLLRDKHNREMEARRLHGVGLGGADDIENSGQRGRLQAGQRGYGQLLDDGNAPDADAAQEDEEKKEPQQDAAVAVKGADHSGEEFDFSEIVIHQLIHTIEYVLGTISNTASYLRLWALSLAHAQLSEVFYHQTVAQTMAGHATATQVIMNVVGQFVFLMATIGVLLIMDPLECFLHALRLHWVEFQNKFFYADGVSFKPFSYRMFLDED